MSTKLSVLSLAAIAALVLSPSPARAQSLAGLWDATVSVNNGALDIPFRFEIAGSGSSIKGSFFNGDEKVTSTSGRFQNGSLVLNFDEMGTALQATLKDGRLEGEYSRGTRGTPYPFQAKRFTPAPEDTEKIPSIAGLWNVQVGKSSKGEAAWQLIVRQSGAEVSAAILRIDGDTGTLTGRYHDGKFVVSHFSGMRPARFELIPGADGSLSVVQGNDKALPAVRMEVADAKGLPKPSDPTRFTSVKDPSEPLRFSFPDLTGKIVSNTDPKFQGKVVIVAIGGSWCPNCHDETPFLVDLYKKYRKQGLEIVELSFEEEAQIKNPVRLKAFIKKYGIDYTVLIPGEPRELNEKMPQGVNLNSFPTTFFLGRDGRVRMAHAGFAGAASGKFYEEGTHEITTEVQKLLAESAPAEIVVQVSVIDPATRIGAVHLTIANLDRSIRFYETHLGFTLRHREGRTARLGAGGPDLLVLTENSSAPRVRGTTGLYHFAILVPSRPDLARALRRLADTRTTMQGAADHGVSEALYLADPDGNGIEIYRDRVRKEWPYVDGRLHMTTDPLDVDDLLTASAADGGDPRRGLDADTVIGHVHLHVAHIAQSDVFYAGVLGFDPTQRYGPSALFVSAGGYHHHVGLNTWAGVGAPAPPRGAIGLRHFEVTFTDTASLAAVEARVRAAGVPIEAADDGLLVRDPASNAMLLRVR